MRWHARRNAPQIGDKKSVILFALFPKRIGRIWIWLERYKVTLEYYYGDWRGGNGKGWAIVNEEFYTKCNKSEEQALKALKKCTQVQKKKAYPKPLYGNSGRSGYSGRR